MENIVNFKEFLQSMDFIIKYFVYIRFSRINNHSFFSKTSILIYQKF